jgi:hypothetical protein
MGPADYYANCVAERSNSGSTLKQKSLPEQGGSCGDPMYKPGTKAVVFDPTSQTEDIE